MNLLTCDLKHSQRKPRCHLLSFGDVCLVALASNRSGTLGGGHFLQASPQVSVAAAGPSSHVLRCSSGEAEGRIFCIMSLGFHRKGHIPKLPLLGHLPPVSMAAYLCPGAITHSDPSLAARKRGSPRLGHVREHLLLPCVGKGTP